MTIDLGLTDKFQNLGKFANRVTKTDGILDEMKEKILEPIPGRKDKY